MRTICTLALMILGQPLAILILGGAIGGRGPILWLVIGLAIIVVSVAILTSHWPRRDKQMAGLVYAALAILTFPALGLWVGCTLGDCI